jgi:cobalamin synthase
MPPLAFFSALAIAAVTCVTATFVAVTPAQATEQSFFGTTGDVLAPVAPR